MHDLILRGGTVVDGTGAPARTADVAVTGGEITAVGRDLGSSQQTVDADGLLVTPGWVDIHTHYDGQATWDAEMAPSLWHGVSTVVMGNCGVGFAPATPDRHRWLIGLMEGVEDIPGKSLAEGMPWDWETFGEYLDSLARLPRTLDVGAMLSHGAVRAYVMGNRGANNEEATPEDIAAMAAVVGDGMAAGALGFSSSRTLIHCSVDGEPVPGTYASEEELVALAKAVKDSGRGVFEMVPNGIAGEADVLLEETRLMDRVARASGAPLVFLLLQHGLHSDQWRQQLEICEAARRDGVALIPQVAARPPAVLFSFQGDNPFEYLPSFVSLKGLPLAEKIARLRDPELKRTLLSEKDPNTTGMSLIYKSPTVWESTYLMGTPLSYTPDTENSIAKIAARENRDPRELAYEMMLENDGDTFLMYSVVNYIDGNSDAMAEMIRSETAVLGLSDAGAHVRQVIDASIHTYMLTHWVRSFEEGHPYHMPLEFVVKKLTSDNAKLFGMNDRGVLRAGAKADINLIDFDNLHVDHPHIVADLPADMPRLMQTAKGYVATYVAGRAVQENGQATGARPGGVVRSG
jgi:N-acyl-D-aspartate/D-glutamate deacylase